MGFQLCARNTFWFSLIWTWKRERRRQAETLQASTSQYVSPDSKLTFTHPYPNMYIRAFIHWLWHMIMKIYCAFFYSLTFPMDLWTQISKIIPTCHPPSSLFLFLIFNTWILERESSSLSYQDSESSLFILSLQPRYIPHQITPSVLLQSQSNLSPSLRLTCIT